MIPSTEKAELCTHTCAHGCVCVCIQQNPVTVRCYCLLERCQNVTVFYGEWDLGVVPFFLWNSCGVSHNFLQVCIY